MLVYASITVNYTLNNAAYFFLIEGEVRIADEKLSSRDALGIEEVKEIEITADKQSKLLIIDVPLH